MDLMTTFGQRQLSRSLTIRFLLVDVDTSYFGLIGRKTLNELGAIDGSLLEKLLWRLDL